MRILAAVELAPALGLRVPGALGGAALLPASGTEPAVGIRWVGSTFDAQATRNALGGLPAGSFALIRPRFLVVPPRLPGGAHPRIPRASGGTGLLGAELADAAIGRWFALAALRTQAGSTALGHTPVVALAVSG
ncbi:MAG: hypothetical protein OXQ86_09715 [Gammaproteobacteria bacterium]|nr:hypothetical protein [Gammaproteobacteria bacterium]MDE0412767.1 hypothetical protein [Gammaproteobacteria bacterium]